MPTRPSLRPFDATRDAADVQRLDTSYASSERYQVRPDGARFLLEPVTASAPVTRSYAIDLTADAWQHARVAVLDDKLCGFIAWEAQRWNRRLAIWHFYVDLPYRRRGVGRSMVDAALAWAAQHDLHTAWVETSNTNTPGITAYRRLGFEICGFDTTLYLGTSNPNEIAIYMARALSPRTPTQ